MQAKSVYLNTDLDIVSSDDLSPLAQIFDEKCVLLHGQKEDDGLWHLIVESEDSGFIGVEDDARLQKHLSDLLDVIESLDDPLKSLLARADQFDFNIGWEAGEERPEGVFSIPNDLLRRIADSGATLAVTVYPPYTDSEENSQA